MINAKAVPTSPTLLAMAGNRYQQGHLRMIERLLRLLDASGFCISVEADFHAYLLSTGIAIPQNVTCAEEFPAQARAVLSLGGDGTFLQTAAWAGAAGNPIMGINTGHLGYLAAFSLDDIDSVIDTLLHGSMRVEQRTVMQLMGDDLPADLYPFALNDITILKQESSSMISVCSELDGHYLADYDADGLILATATGSTAYNLSAGGPLLQPHLDNIVISPVAPHALTMRPLVVGGTSRISAVTTSRAGCYRVSVDGRSFTLPSGTRIEIATAPYRVSVLLRPGTTFADTLRHKLNWARR